MNVDQLKDRMANLPEDAQDAIAQLAISELKKRSRLEQIATGSIWNKLGLIIPLIVSLALLGIAFLGIKTNLAENLPLIIAFLLTLMQGMFFSVHSRIDAIHQLVKLDRENQRERNNGV